MAKYNIALSLDAYDEIMNSLEAQGVKLERNDSIAFTKDMAIKAPVNYKQVQIRRDILIECVKVYKSPMEGDYEINDVNQFIEFVDNVYNYILTGEIKQDKDVKENQTKSNSWK